MAAPPPESFVEVVYATADEQRVVQVRFYDGLTAGQAARESGLLADFPDAARRLVLGVFGNRVDSSHRLEPGDRVEICRPLFRDPRDRRRELAK